MDEMNFNRDYSQNETCTRKAKVPFPELSKKLVSRTYSSEKPQLFRARPFKFGFSKLVSIGD